MSSTGEKMSKKLTASNSSLSLEQFLTLNEWGVANKDFEAGRIDELPEPSQKQVELAKKIAHLEPSSLDVTVTDEWARRNWSSVPEDESVKYEAACSMISIAKMMLEHVARANDKTAADDAEHVSSPRGRVMLYPADKRLERVARALTLTAEHVVRTPEQFVDEGKEQEQEWAVMPDLPSNSPDFKPISKHRTRAQATAYLETLDDRSRDAAEHDTTTAVGQWLRPEKAAVLAWAGREAWQKENS